MTNENSIRIGFHTHGLGDVVHCCHAMRLYMARGYDVQIQVEPNKRWVWQAAGIPIYDGAEQLPIHPYYYPDMGKFWDLSTPDHLYSKIAHLFEIAELPKLGTKEEVWRLICNERINAAAAVSPEAIADVAKFLEGLPKPIVLLHSKGTNWQEEKSIPDATAFQLIRELIASFDGSVVVLDWDARAPSLGHRRVRTIHPHFDHMDTEHFGALCQLSDLMIGIDSGPFHLAGWFDLPTLFVSRKIPPVRCCLPSPNATYLVSAANHEDWASRGPEWIFAEFKAQEVSVKELLITALTILGERDQKMRPVRMTQIEPDLIPGQYTYHRVGHDQRPVELLPGGKIGIGAAGCERIWAVESTPVGAVLTIYGEHGGPTCNLAMGEDGVLRGRWLHHERMPIELIPDPERAVPIPETVKWDDLEDAADIAGVAGEVVTPQDTSLIPDVPGRYLYRRIGHDERTLTLAPGGKITDGAGGCELAWKIERTPRGAVLTIYGHLGGPTCHLSVGSDGVFRGTWLAHEKMPIELIRQTEDPAESPKCEVPTSTLSSPARRFVVGIPTLNRYDLLERCISACKASSVTSERIIIIDNGRGLSSNAFGEAVQILQPMKNLGVAASWNMIHRISQPLDLIILNDDIEPGHNMFERLLDNPESFVTADESHMFEAFLIRQDVWKAVGEFDETFYPAYHEDNDYAMRLGLANIAVGCPQSDGYVENGPSATKARFTQEQLNEFNAQFDYGRRYYVRKWGGTPHLETFTAPFNGQSRKA